LVSLCRRRSLGRQRVRSISIAGCPPRSLTLAPRCSSLAERTFHSTPNSALLPLEPERLVFISLVSVYSSQSRSYPTHLPTHERHSPKPRAFTESCGVSLVSSEPASRASVPETYIPAPGCLVQHTPPGSKVTPAGTDAWQAWHVVPKSCHGFWVDIESRALARGTVARSLVAFPLRLASRHIREGHITIAPLSHTLFFLIIIT
jgi:hypothetical protein